MKRHAANYEVIGDEILFHCPECGGPMAAPVTDAALPVVCPHCEADILAPDLDAGLGPGMTVTGLEKSAWEHEARIRAARERGHRHDPEFTGSRPGDRSVPEPEAGAASASNPDATNRGNGTKRFPDPEFRGDSRRPAPHAESSETPMIETTDAQRTRTRADAIPRRRRIRRRRHLWERENRDDAHAADLPPAEPAHLRRRTPVLLAVCGVLVGGGLWLALVLGPGRNTEDPNASAQAPDDDPAFIARQRAAEAVARQALTATSPDDLLPILRQAPRVAPILARYHAERPFVTRNPASLTAGQFIEGQAGHFWEFQYALEGGGAATVVVAEEDGAFRFDWELFADAASFEWAEFLRDRPDSGTPLRVTVRRSSMPDRILRKFGPPESPERGIGLRLWCNDIDESVYAILDGDSELGRAIAADTDWNRGRRMVLAVSVAGTDGIDTYVTIHDRLFNGWIYPDEATIPGDAVAEGGTTPAAGAGAE